MQVANLKRVQFDGLLLNIIKFLTLLIICMLIVLGTYYSVFSVIACIIVAVVIIALRFQYSLAILFFLLPFASLIKITPNSQSLFTYLCLFCVMWNIIKSRSFDKNFFGAFLIFCLYLLLGAFNNLNLSRLIKFLSNIFIIYYALKLKDENNYYRIFLFFILGMIASSLLAVLDVIPNLTEYIAEIDLWRPNNSLERFTGLYPDPNYYSVNLIISLCLIAILYHNKKINGLSAAIMSLFILWFIILTYSKSAFLMLALPILLWLYLLIKRKKYISLLIAVIALIAVVISSLKGNISIFDVVLSRLDSADSLSSLTTGRFDLWIEYLAYIFEHGGIALFGAGFGADLPYSHAAHNTYIDFLYYLGIFGTALFIVIILIVGCNKALKVKHCFLNYSIWICIGVMYFFLSELFFVDLPFHLILAILVYRINFSSKCEKSISVCC